LTVEIVGRAQWGARYPDGCGPAPLPAAEAYLHHSATIAPPADASQPLDAAKIRELEDIGQARFGCGISYTWCVTPSGRVFQGHSPGRQGTHTLGHNDAARGIVLVGNYSTARPTPAQVTAVAGLLALAFRQGWLTRPRLTGGHRDVVSTECPGDAAYALIPRINQEAGGGVREGIDFSGSYPPAAAMRAAGRDFVVRYARKTGSLDKQITSIEAAYWRANGIDVGIVDEAGSARALDGFAAGAADARAAAAAVAGVGGPGDGGVIYMAVDFDATPAQTAGLVRQFIAGAASVLGYDRTGVYGSYAVVRYMLDNRVCRYAWQTYAWSAGQWDARAHLQQYRNGQTLGGVAVDFNRAPAVDFGQWGGQTGDWFDMATEADLVRIVDDRLKANFGATGGCTENVGNRTMTIVRDKANLATANQVGALGTVLDGLRTAVGRQADDEGMLAARMDTLAAGLTTTLAQVRAAQGTSVDAVAAVHEAILGLVGTVAQLTPGGSLDLDELAAKVGDVVTTALSGSILTITRQ
jgi:hypothetical protein